jgi:hypothetical protein
LSDKKSNPTHLRFSQEVRTLLDQMIIADVKARWTLAKVRSYAWCLIGQDAR